MADKPTAAERDRLARAGFEAAEQYAQRKGGGSVCPWEELPDRWKDMWREVGAAIAAAVKEPIYADRPEA